MPREINISILNPVLADHIHIVTTVSEPAINNYSGDRPEMRSTSLNWYGPAPLKGEYPLCRAASSGVIKTHFPLINIVNTNANPVIPCPICKSSDICVKVEVPIDIHSSTDGIYYSDSTIRMYCQTCGLTLDTVYIDDKPSSKEFDELVLEGGTIRYHDIYKLIPYIELLITEWNNRFRKYLRMHSLLEQEERNEREETRRKEAADRNGLIRRPLSKTR